MLRNLEILRTIQVHGTEETGCCYSPTGSCKSSQVCWRSGTPWPEIDSAEPPREDAWEMDVSWLNLAYVLCCFLVMTNSKIVISCCLIVSSVTDTCWHQYFVFQGKWRQNTTPALTSTSLTPSEPKLGFPSFHILDVNWIFYTSKIELLLIIRRKCVTSTPLWSKNFHPMTMCFLDSKIFNVGNFFCDTIHNRHLPRKYLTGADLNQTGPVFLRPWQLNWEATAGLRGYIDPVLPLLYDWFTLHVLALTQHRFKTSNHAT